MLNLTKEGRRFAKIIGGKYNNQVISVSEKSDDGFKYGRRPKTQCTPFGGTRNPSKVVSPPAYVQNKVALTGFYDKMRMISNIDNVPYGYNPL